MELHSKFKLGVFLFVLFSSCGLSIKCFSCRSEFDPKCADPFDNSTIPITDCNREEGLSNLPGNIPKLCRKIIQKVNGDIQYIRDCGYHAGGIENKDFIEYSMCDHKDGCNSSSMFAPVPLLLIALVTMRQYIA